MKRLAVGPLLTATCIAGAAVGLSHCGGVQTGHEKGDGGVADAGPLQGACNTSTENAQLQVLATALRDFHQDTTGWPYLNRIWLAGDTTGQSPTFLPGLSFTVADTAAFELPAGIPSPLGLTPLPPCGSEPTVGPDGGVNPCWNGPYLTPVPPGTTAAQLGSLAPWLDCWGNARMYSYVQPCVAGSGGCSISQALNGAVFVWSRGPDGHDGFTCSDNTCPGGFSTVDFLKGQCSQAVGCDDIIVEVANSSF